MHRSVTLHYRANVVAVVIAHSYACNPQLASCLSYRTYAPIDSVLMPMLALVKRAF